jgi:hypothetical protein
MPNVGDAMNKPCILCGGPIRGKPLYDDGVHNNVETCITNLKKRIVQLEKQLAKKGAA